MRKRNIIEASLLIPYSNAIINNRKQNDDRAIIYNRAVFIIKFSLGLGFVLVMVNTLFF